MKRFLFILVALSLFVTCVHAESIDLENMSTDSLVVLRDAINAELAKRNFAEKEVLVNVGEYIIGVDIPAGVYTISLHENVQAMQSLLTVYSEKRTPVTAYNIFPSDPIGRHELKEGQIIQILFGSVVFSPYKGLGF